MIFRDIVWGMIRPEDSERIRTIQETVAKAQEPKARQGFADKEAEKAKEDLNKARLVATGVVALFEQLRNSGVVKMEDSPVFKAQLKDILDGENTYIRVKVSDYAPAIVHFTGPGEEVILLFDEHLVASGSLTDSSDRHYELKTRSIKARILPDNRLEVNGEIVNDNLDEVVTRAILRAKGLVASSCK